MQHEYVSVCPCRLLAVGSAVAKDTPNPFLLLNVLNIKNEQSVTLAFDKNDASLIMDGIQTYLDEDHDTYTDPYGSMN